MATAVLQLFFFYSVSSSLFNTYQHLVCLAWGSPISISIFSSLSVSVWFVLTVSHLCFYSWDRSIFFMLPQSPFPSLLLLPLISTAHRRTKRVACTNTFTHFYWRLYWQWVCGKNYSVVVFLCCKIKASRLILRAIQVYRYLCILGRYEIEKWATFSSTSPSPGKNMDSMEFDLLGFVCVIWVNAERWAKMSTVLLI